MTLTPEKLRDIVEKKIDAYGPKGGLDYSARFFLCMASVKHGPVVGHVERVALLCEYVADRQGKDKRAAFFAGLLHDAGKVVLPWQLFDGHNISSEEYEEVKTHAIAGWSTLKSLHLFTALCAGLHHALYKKGYGLERKDFPENLEWSTVKKVLEVSAILSICDYVEAATFRKTKIKDGSDPSSDLKQALYDKFPDDHVVVDHALQALTEINL